MAWHQIVLNSFICFSYNNCNASFDILSLKQYNMTIQLTNCGMREQQGSQLPHFLFVLSYNSLNLEKKVNVTIIIIIIIIAYRIVITNAGLSFS